MLPQQQHLAPVVVEHLHRFTLVEHLAGLVAGRLLGLSLLGNLPQLLLLLRRQAPQHLQAAWVGVAVHLPRLGLLRVAAMRETELQGRGAVDVEGLQPGASPAADTADHAIHGEDLGNGESCRLPARSRWQGR